MGLGRLVVSLAGKRALQLSTAVAEAGLAIR